MSWTFQPLLPAATDLLATPAIDPIPPVGVVVIAVAAIRAATR